MVKKHKKLRFVLLGILAAALLAAVTFVSIEFWYYAHYKSSKTEFNIAAQAQNDGEISVMSANVRCISPGDLGKKSWLYRADLIIQNIAANAPDIIGFQEVTKFHYDYLNDCLPGYDSILTYRDDTFFTESCPIYYRTDKFDLIDKGSFWLSETPEQMSKDWGAACYRICSYVILSEKASGQQFVVFNTHLDHVSDEARIKGIGVVLDKIAQFGSLPAMIMGDFNADEDSTTYQMATENFLDTKYQTENTMTSSTYQNWGEKLDNPCIDYIMVSKTGLAVDSYKVVTTTYDGVYPSDHFPVCVDLRLTKENENG